MHKARKNDSAPLKHFAVQKGEIFIIRVDASVSAGFPSPAEDFFEGSIDLKSELMPNPDASFIVKVSGDSMQDAHIDDGDVLIIDRSVQPSNGCIAVCFLNGAFTVKRLEIRGKHIRLLPSNPAFQPIPIVEGDELSIWGVVTYIIKKPG